MKLPFTYEKANQLYKKYYQKRLTKEQKEDIKRCSYALYILEEYAKIAIKKGHECFKIDGLQLFDPNRTFYWELITVEQLIRASEMFIEKYPYIKFEQLHSGYEIVFIYSGWGDK